MASSMARLVISLGQKCYQVVEVDVMYDESVFYSSVSTRSPIFLQL